MPLTNMRNTLDYSSVEVCCRGKAEAHEIVAVTIEWALGRSRGESGAPPPQWGKKLLIKLKGVDVECDINQVNKRSTIS